MSDTLSQWNFDRSWSYNHGRSPGINADRNAVPAFTGLNQLLGDGSVSWKGAGRFNLADMNNSSTNNGVVKGYSIDADYF
jgi:hypothetical protein